MLIVGIGCRRLRGKDTVAARLYARYDYARLAIGDRIKQCAAAMFGSEVGPVEAGAKDSPLEGPVFQAVAENAGLQLVTRRWIWQRLGTEVAHNFGPDVWINGLLRNAVGFARVVIPDIRYPVEAEAVKAAGGLLIRIDRDIPYDAAQDDHRSEHALDYYGGWDYIVDNNGTVDDLYRQVDDLRRW